MGLIPNTYNGLVSAVKALAEDDSTEFENYIPVAIFLAEERLTKELDTEGLHVQASINGSAGDNIVYKPSKYRLGYDMSFRTSSGSTYLIKKTQGFVQDYWPVGKTSTSAYERTQPKYYCDRNNSEFLIAPTPVSAYTYRLDYLEKVSSLGVSVQSNYFTEFTSDALFYGTMSNMSEFMKDYGTQQIWETKYVNAIQGTNNQGKRERRDNSSDPKNPRSQRNTLKGDN